MTRRLEELDLSTLKSWLADWLASPEAAEAPLGLEVEEALRRAEQLRPLVIAGVISPDEIELDEDLKDVLYALVSLVATRRAADPHGARAVYRFLRALSWPDDELGEKDDLMNRCAAAAQEFSRTGAGVEPSEMTMTGTNEEIRKIFEESAPLVRSILVKHHELTEAEAVEFEKDLLTWFARFCQRSRCAAAEMRRLLLAQCSRLAREYQRFRGRGPAEPAEARLAELFGWAAPERTPWNRGSRKIESVEGRMSRRSSRK